MAANSRIITGFHRLGIVFAFPLFVAAIVLAFLEWKSPSGPVSTKIPEGAFGFQFDENSIDSGVREILTEQQIQGFSLPRNFMFVGVPVGQTVQDGNEWTKIKLADGREIGIASKDNKQVTTVARTFLLNEKHNRHLYSNTDNIKIDGVAVKFLTFFDQDPPVSSPWLVRSSNWTFAVASLVAAITIYIMIWALGWVIRGFNRPSR